MFLGALLTSLCPKQHQSGLLTTSTWGSLPGGFRPLPKPTFAHLSGRPGDARKLPDPYPTPHCIPRSYCCCSVAKSCPVLCNPMDCSMPGFLCCLPECAQTHVHWLCDAIQSFHWLLPTSSAVINLSHHRSLFQWVISLHQVDKLLELQLQHQSFQWIFRIDS